MVALALKDVGAAYGRITVLSRSASIRWKAAV